jgi:hypothetical protein
MSVAYKLRGSVAEPLSRQALQHMRALHDEDAPDLVFPHMKSDSLKRVVYELLRYCRGEIDGISVLISGQRGAGKTTLVKLAIQEVMQDSDGLIPLPLMLHGPTIIDPAAVPAAEKKVSLDEQKPLAVAADGTPVVVVNTAAPLNEAQRGALAESDKKPTVPEEKERALSQIVTALYRSLSQAIYEAWLNAAAEAFQRRRTHRELLALRAHLDLRLERAPDPDVLRKIWERAGFLNCGVSFYLRPAKKNPVTKSCDRNSNPPAIAGHPSDQGLREIVALASCADAYRVIISNTQERVGRTQLSEYLQERKLSTPQGGEKKPEDGKAKSPAEKAAPPVLGVVSGTLGGLALQTANLDPAALLAGLGTGLLVWLASWMAMNYGVRTSRQEMRRELTMDIKWDIDRLERDLPILLKRVKDAGFAPIFVLDELDKAHDATKALHNFLRLTKHIVTDHSSFMFLTNRDYYEDLISGEQLKVGSNR